MAADVGVGFVGVQGGVGGYRRGGLGLVEGELGVCVDVLVEVFVGVEIEGMGFEERGGVGGHAFGCLAMVKGVHLLRLCDCGRERSVLISVRVK